LEALVKVCMFHMLLNCYILLNIFIFRH
jgi:hypothetical protein